MLSLLCSLLLFLPPVSGGLECAHRILASRMSRLKRCRDGSASTAWDHAGLLCNLYQKENRCVPKMLPSFSNLSWPIPTQPLLHMVQHVADCAAPFPRSQHSPPPPLKFFHTPASPSSPSSLPYMHEN